VKLPFGDATGHRRLYDLVFFEKTHGFPELAEPHPEMILAVFQHPRVGLVTHADAVNLVVFLIQKTREQNRILSETSDYPNAFHFSDFFFFSNNPTKSEIVVSHGGTKAQSEPVLRPDNADFPVSPCLCVKKTDRKNHKIKGGMAGKQELIISKYYPSQPCSSITVNRVDRCNRC